MGRENGEIMQIPHTVLPLGKGDVSQPRDTCWALLTSVQCFRPWWSQDFPLLGSSCHAVCENAGSPVDATYDPFSVIVFILFKLTRMQDSVAGLQPNWISRSEHRSLLFPPVITVEKSSTCCVLHTRTENHVEIHALLSWGMDWGRGSFSLPAELQRSLQGCWISTPTIAFGFCVVFSSISMKRNCNQESQCILRAWVWISVLLCWLQCLQNMKLSGSHCGWIQTRGWIPFECDKTCFDKSIFWFVNIWK